MLRHQRSWHYTLFLGGWSAPLIVPDLDSEFVDMVLSLKLLGAHHRLHLGARHATPPAHGSIDELCLEVHVAHVAGGCRLFRGMAISTGRRDSLACQFGNDRCCVFLAWPRRRNEKQDCEADVQFC